MQRLKQSLVGQIMVAIVLGTIVGLIFKDQTASLGALGSLLVQAIKTVAAPLVFFAIVDAIISSDIKWKSVRHLLVIIGINSLVAGLIGMVLANTIKPGSYLQMESLTSSPESLAKFQQLEKINLLKSLGQVLPSNIVSPFLENTIISIVVLAVFFGAGLRVAKKKNIDQQHVFVTIENFFTGTFQVLNQILHWIILLAPFAIFGIMAKTVGQHGFSPFKGLAMYVIVAVLGLTLQVVIVYHGWLLLLKMNIRNFWSIVKVPVLNAWGCNSSLAALPLTLDALEKLKVSKASSRLGACVATNLNNDGILLYEAMAVLFVAQAHGLHLGVGQQIEILLLCVIAAIGITGVPEAGIISLSIVLVTVGMPLEILPLLLTVDWVIARGRSVVNVLSDIIVSLAVDRWPKKR